MNAELREKRRISSQVVLMMLIGAWFILLVGACRPLLPPVADALNLPEYAAGYTAHLSDVIFTLDAPNRLAVRYRYDPLVGGGMNTYAAFYGWDLGSDVIVLYELVPRAGCAPFDSGTIPDWDAIDGVYVMTREGTLLSQADYVDTTC